MLDGPVNEGHEFLINSQFKLHCTVKQTKMGGIRNT